MRWRIPPAGLPAIAFLAGAFCAPRLAIPPVAVLPVLLAVLGALLRSSPGVALSAGALGLLWAELAWVAPIRASPGWDLERPVDALFVPDDAWEARD
ncbi:MAG TPA: hypothetical protein VHR17_02645, partial [Thermoanaerobaculia bacterium]|nr:hypothetical protein [Thermoanaerobaculia bacterium]